MSKRKPAPPDPAPVGELVDAHTHLAACGGRDRDAVQAIVDRAAKVGVGQVVTVADDMVDARWAVAASEWDHRVFAAVALHPTHAADLNAETADELEQMAGHDRVVAVGETGLDYYWLGKSASCPPKDVQAQAFRWHIGLAKRIGKPLMIHNREADADLLDILADEGEPETVIMHCFSGDESVARECVRRGYFLSFSGTVTFSNAQSLQDAARVVPDDQLLVETDAPFLTPHPYRGAPNQSYCLPYTVQSLARTRGQEPSYVAKATRDNAQRAYRLGS